MADTFKFALGSRGVAGRPLPDFRPPRAHARLALANPREPDVRTCASLIKALSTTHRRNMSIDISREQCAMAAPDSERVSVNMVGRGACGCTWPPWLMLWLRADASASN